MGYLTVKVNMKDWGISTNLVGMAKRAEHAVAQAAATDTNPYVPMLTGSLSNRTQVKDNLIIYPGPYARYLYYGKKMVDAATGRGPMLIPDVGYRYHKGATLKPTNQDLNIQQTVHPHAQAHWFEASKAQNLDKWKRVAAKAVTKYGK